MLTSHLSHAACFRGCACAPPMTKTLLSAVAVLLLLGNFARADGPLTVIPPTPDWTVRYTKTDKAETYTFQPPDPHTADFAFSRWTVDANSDQIPGYLETLAKGFVQQAQLNPKIQLASYDYEKGEFIGFPYSGKYAAFTFRTGVKEYLFIFGDNTGLWSGHFIGSSQGWLDAMEVLKAVKKS
jgi:hypothetical protein